MVAEIRQMSWGTADRDQMSGWVLRQKSEYGDTGQKMIGLCGTNELRFMIAVGTAGRVWRSVGIDSAANDQQKRVFSRGSNYLLHCSQSIEESQQ